MDKLTKKDQNEIDNLTEEMGVLYGTLQNSMLNKINIQLLKGITAQQDIETWKAVQQRQNKNLDAKLEWERKRFDKVIDAKMKKCEELTGVKLNVQLPDNKGKILDANGILIDSALKYQKEAYRNVLMQVSNRQVYGVQDYLIRKAQPDDLYNAIFKQTQKGIENGLQVVYKNGRKMSFRNYMEMNVRTTINSELSATQLKAGEMNQVVFYLCNSFGDSATDHGEFQGAYYFDDNWHNFDLSDELRDKIQEYIDDNKLMSVQEVRDNPPYLTTRPNCRHTLNPMTIGEVLDYTPKEMLKKYNLEEGKYQMQKYKASQQLRYSERNIRAYKDRLEMNQQLYDNAPPQMKAKYLNQIAKDKLLVRKWQKEANKIAKQWDFKRDYRRETSKVMLNDLGAKYNQP